ncbi:MAG: Hydrophobe/amphiphile efflux [Polaromonas sp.]|jgi:multidrug efflux pump subunit AcrB|nr:Hydrophobe/amphiphile efflux [Polaromonas sp.]
MRLRFQALHPRFYQQLELGILFVSLRPFDVRKGDDLSAGAIAGRRNAKFGSIEIAFNAMFAPPSVQGPGTIGGFKLPLEDRASLG